MKFRKRYGDMDRRRAEHEVQKRHEDVDRDRAGHGQEQYLVQVQSYGNKLQSRFITVAIG